MRPPRPGGFSRTSKGTSASPDRLDLRRLGGGSPAGSAPRICSRLPARTRVVSTIHRAKGLEFDNVVLVNPSDLLTGTATDEDASVAYVAITRGRDQLMAARCASPDFLRVDKRSGRWFVGGYERWMTRGFELRGADSRSPADACARRACRLATSDAPSWVGSIKVASTLDVPDLLPLLRQTR